MLVAGFAIQAIAAYRKRRRLLAGLREHWGQPLRGAREHRPVAARTPTLPPSKAAFLDDMTWSDLGLEQVFARIDRTLSSVGAQRLHCMLRCPQVELAA
ncbi:MAG: hypothetical protein R6X02_26375, partial [Enhygromyxa sp.]